LRRIYPTPKITRLGLVGILALLINSFFLLQVLKNRVFYKFYFEVISRDWLWYLYVDVLLGIKAAKTRKLEDFVHPHELLPLFLLNIAVYLVKVLLYYARYALEKNFVLYSVYAKPFGGAFEEGLYYVFLAIYVLVEIFFDVIELLLFFFMPT